jgi:hypothetical protein
MSCSTTTTARVSAASTQDIGGVLALGQRHAGGRFIDQQQRGSWPAACRFPAIASARATARPALRASCRQADLVRPAPRSVAHPRARPVEQHGERASGLSSAPSADCRAPSGPRTRWALELAAEPGARDLAFRHPQQRDGSSLAPEHRPSSGRVLPVTMSMKVVLPAPLGPMMARSSAGPISNDRLLIALNPSNETEKKPLRLQEAHSWGVRLLLTKRAGVARFVTTGGG